MTIDNTAASRADARPRTHTAALRDTSTGAPVDPVLELASGSVRLTTSVTVGGKW
jgi:hypothetical protein